MLDFFKEGGWGMWAILVFGLITLGAAIRFAARPERRQMGFLGAMSLTTVIATLNATWTDFGAVFNALSDEKRVPDADLTRTMWEGLKESTRPGAFGGGLLTIACLLFAVGVLRMNRREE
jgi:Na+/H+ antiporter NhaC